MILSRTKQDYIKAIWNLSQSGRKVKMKNLADMLGVKPPSVVAMFKELERIGLMTYNKVNGAQLNEKGREEAERIIRKHRLIETFLQRVLQIEEPLLHDEAEKLEHVMSDQLIMKIDAFLEYPNIDPHGSVIPFSKGKEIKYLLSELEPDISFKVFRIPMMGNEKTFCSDNGFLPGSEWTIAQIDPNGESYLLTNGKNYLAISNHMAEKIKVSIIRT
jgi:DtxR family Mn-dependent transcriptional regulator